MEYRETLFNLYNESHASQLDRNREEKMKWFKQHFETNYHHHLTSIEAENPSILEIGCNKGYLISALSAEGYDNITGIDLSETEIEIAREISPEANFLVADAMDYLEDRQSEFDVVIIKAVIEHLEKQNVIAMLKQIYNSLRTSGFVLVEVPNMDWIYASHERYMDYTHEVGFTPTSLGQVMRVVYDSVEVDPIHHLPLQEDTLARLKRLGARKGIDKLLDWALVDNVGETRWARSIMGKGIKAELVCQRR